MRYGMENRWKIVCTVYHMQRELSQLLSKERRNIVHSVLYKITKSRKVFLFDIEMSKSQVNDIQRVNDFEVIVIMSKKIGNEFSIYIVTEFFEPHFSCSHI